MKVGVRWSGDMQAQLFSLRCAEARVEQYGYIALRCINPIAC
jgi:hypothetical protein